MDIQRVEQFNKPKSSNMYKKPDNTQGKGKKEDERKVLYMDKITLLIVHKKGFR